MVALLQMPERMERTQPLPRRESAGRGTLKLASDRRLFPRRELQLTVEGRRLDHTIPARRDPKLRLDLRDVSAGGLSAWTQVPVTVGENLAVHFPPMGIRPGMNARGRVIRCEPSSFGWRVAVEFDNIPAAA